MIVGPTASGKTDLALRLGNDLPLALISADSMQVYRGMDIGTAKPPSEQRKQFALIDFVEPGNQYSAGQFARDATRCCEEAWNRGQVPCLVGGSGLYLRSLLQGTTDLPPIPSEIRAQVEAMPTNLRIERLMQCDPESAAKIELRNPRRVSRALEVFLSTGRGLLSWQRDSTRNALVLDQRLGFCLDPKSEELRDRIRMRNKIAMQDGWLDETRHLAEQYGADQIRATGAIGYSELLDVAEGRLTLEEAEERIEIRTWQYARRQRTWFRSEAGLLWNSDFEEIEKAVHQFIKG